MIISVNTDSHKSEFSNLLSSTIEELNLRAKNSSNRVAKLEGRNLEPYVQEVMTDLAVGTPFEGSIELIGGQKFPDIIAKKFFGIEVKTTTQNHWKTTGNSVLESTRVPDVERIYMLFAKLASPIEFRCRPYEEVLSEVVVTHSPRYLIDMNLEKGKTIFDKINMSYDNLRTQDNPIRPIVDYYKSKLKPGEELWWMDNSDEGGVKLTFWSKISKTKELELILRSMVLFPEVFSSSPVKYSRISFWLLTNEKIICPNMRDHFSAGGKGDYTEGITTYEKIPRILIKLFDNIDVVIKYLLNTSSNELSQYWGKETTEETKIFDWINSVSTNSSKMKDCKNLNVQFILNRLIFR